MNIIQGLHVTRIKFGCQRKKKKWWSWCWRLVLLLLLREGRNQIWFRLDTLLFFLSFSLASTFEICIYMQRGVSCKWSKEKPSRSPPLYQIFFLSSVLATAAGHHFLLYFSYIHKIPFSRDMAVGHARCWWQHFAPRFLSNPSHLFPFFFF